MDPTDLPRALVAEQDGVATRRQLIASGVSPSAIRWRTGRGSWRYLLPGIILIDGPRPTRRQELIAAALLGGPDAAISGVAGARLHGLTTLPPRRLVRVLVPPTRRRRTVGFADIRPTVVVPPVTRVDRLVVAAPARCVLDAAEEVGDQRAADAVTIEAVQRRIVDLDDLEHCLAGLGQRHTHRARKALAAAATGAWSVPEAELLRLLAGSSTLPAPWPNPRLFAPDGSRLLSPDAWWDDVGLAVMVHSRTYHEGGHQWDTTVARDRELTLAGVLVVGTTPWAITREPRRVLTDIEAAHAVAARRPRPAVTALPQA